MSELIKDRPLAYGFIEDGNLHSLIKWPFMEEVSVFQPVGKSLVDFIRFDRDFMQSVFEILLVRYMQAKEHKNDYNFIAAVLWEVAMQHRLIGTNNYLIVKDIKRARLLNWLWIATTAVLFVGVAWWTVFIMLAIRVLLPRFFRAEVNYELDTEAANEWEKFAEFFSTLKTSKKLWVIETSQSVMNTKTNAGAGRNLTRSLLTLKKTKANRAIGFGVFSNAPCFKLKGKQCTILFLPCDIIIKKGKHIVACAYENLEIRTGTTNFIETDPVPKDATIIRYTWQFVNKDGSADKRYSNNRKLPVCQYGRIMLQAGDQIGVEIHVSNAATTANIGTAYRYYANYLEELSFHNQAAALSSTFQGDNTDDDAAHTAEIPAAINDNYSDIFDSAEGSAEQNALIDEMMMFLKEE